MYKHTLILLLILSLLCGCSGGSSGAVSSKESAKPESAVVRLALNDSGHILSAIADKQGYYADEGIKVEYVPVSSDAEVFAGIQNGEIDIASNSGTNLPLQMISEGMDLTIFGGYLLTGCMPVFARVDTEWVGIQDLVGKTMACEPNLYAVSGPLLDMGYDPLKDVTWMPFDTQEERIEAVKNGTADFGLVGTALNSAVIDDPELKIVTYAADILPDYSCCRAEALNSWVAANPTTLKALLKAWIRALAYYDAHHEETVQMVMELIHKDEDYVRSYLDNPRFELNTDPMKNAIERAWSYMSALGLLDSEAEKIDIHDHINTTLYKAALDECQEQYGTENPKFYEHLQAQYARSDLD